MPRRHYESLNYEDGQGADANFRFTRTQGQPSGYLTDNYDYAMDTVLTKAEVEALRDMLSEVLEDWK